MIKKLQRNKRMSLMLGIMLVSGLFFFLVGNSILAFAEKLTLPKEAVEIQTPTIFVPGTNGTVNRFDSLIKQLKTEHQNNVLKITVNKDGSITKKGSLAIDDSQPIIVVGFKDSSDETLTVQGKWFQQALAEIQKYYLFDTYNYVGHSNGGLVITSYLEEFQKETDPTLAKLITIGTPFNGTSTTDNEAVTTFTKLKTTTDLLAGYLTLTENIPKTIQMLNIAGEVEDTASDNTVPVQSVFSGRYIYQEQIESYEEILVKGKETNHSALVENQQVIDEIKAFFW
ncbi:alpha/beta hydrolase [Enterococcus sp. LJL99]